LKRRRKVVRGKDGRPAYKHWPTVGTPDDDSETRSRKPWGPVPVVMDIDSSGNSIKRAMRFDTPHNPMTREEKEDAK